MYRRFVLLLDVEVRFDCTGSHKLDFFAFLAAPGTVGVLSRGPAARVSGERSPPCPREVVVFFGHAWMVLLCCDGVSMVL